MKDVIVMTENIWFHWERNATFTPIFMCMEAWGQPTAKYWGVSWPTTICVWKNDIISWNNKNQDFYEMGKILVENFLKNGWGKFEDEINETAIKITKFMRECNPIADMSEHELVRKFKELHNLWIHWFVLGVTEPPGVYGEKILEELSKDKKNFSLLTSPIRKSFSRREFEDLLQVKNDKELENHAKKYFWLHNNYFTTETISKEFFQDKLLEAIGKIHGLSLKEMKHVLPEEILNNKIDRNLIRERMEHFMVIWDSDRAKFELILDTDEIEQKKKQIFGEKQQTKEIIEIEGQIASKGRLKGRAFVTMSAHDAKNIKPGEILVTSMTSPDFIVAIKRAAAIVTNEGGILCHAAVVSREFGIPCIVGTQNATRLVKTGDMIEVDGNHGFVRILKK